MGTLKKKEKENGLEVFFNFILKPNFIYVGYCFIMNRILAANISSITSHSCGKGVALLKRRGGAVCLAEAKDNLQTFFHEVEARERFLPKTDKKKKLSK